VKPLKRLRGVTHFEGRWGPLQSPDPDNTRREAAGLARRALREAAVPQPFASS